MSSWLGFKHIIGPVESAVKWHMMHALTDLEMEQHVELLKLTQTKIMQELMGIPAKCL